MKILLTGIAGFIGSTMADILEEMDHEVIGVDAMIEGSSFKNLKINWPRRSFWKTRVEDITLKGLEDNLYEVNAIIHMAALSNNDTAIKNPRSFEANIAATSNICKIATDLRVPIVCIGTDEEYGPFDIEEVDVRGWLETSRLNPTSMYAASKASSTLCALSYFKTYGTDVRVTRGANTYGIRQQDKLIPTILKKQFLGEKIPIFKTPASRCWIHVRDHCEAVLTVLKRGAAGEIYNISGDEHYSPLEVAKMFVSEEDIEIVPDRMGYDPRYYCNDSKIRTLGWKPGFNLKDSVSSLESWYSDAYRTGYFD